MISIRHIEKCLELNADKFSQEKRTEILNDAKAIFKDGKLDGIEEYQFKKKHGLYDMLMSFQILNSEIYHEIYLEDCVPQEPEIAQTIGELIDIVGRGSTDEQHPGPDVVKVKIWDGRMVVANYCDKAKGLYNGNDGPDIASKESMIWDDEGLKVLIEKLLNNGQSFITEYASESYVTHILVWTIKDSK